uniref:Scaffolding anchor of CK1 domain-containing protein n=1 Tax=Eptatretus burgeri TaxID=7764 RepID=A0A8C4RA04_EPTBU
MAKLTTSATKTSAERGELTPRGSTKFLYSESQRLALEALVDGGREAFARVLDEEGLWQFLSEEEIRRICTTIGQNGENGGDHLIGEGMPGGADSRSLTYWPEESDDMAPGRLDLGWPDKEGYRGVTRAAVYTQPPADFNPSIKETVRRLIRNAQTLIAIAMDRFTDVEILRDVAMVAWRSNIPAYVILDEAHVSAFTDACEACNLHTGVLKNMRVRSVAGGSFQTRSGKILHGPTSQKFMMIDGDKALCGSYSFTWTASRLERNIVTVLTGQVVENFDKEFRVLYAASRPVLMERLKLAPEPSRPNNSTRAPSPLPSGKTQESTCSLRHPKYALVRSGSPLSRKLIAHREKEDGDETHGEGREKESDDYVQKTGDHQKEDEKENHDLLLHVPKRIGESRAASDGAVKGSNHFLKQGPRIMLSISGQPEAVRDSEGSSWDSPDMHIDVSMSTH